MAKQPNRIHPSLTGYSATSIENVKNNWKRSLDIRLITYPVNFEIKVFYAKGLVIYNFRYNSTIIQIIAILENFAINVLLSNASFKIED